MSADRKRPPSIHDVPEDPNAATVNFAAASPAARAAAEAAQDDEPQATFISPPAPRRAPQPRGPTGGVRRPALQPEPELEPSSDDDDPSAGVEATSNFGARAAPARRLKGPMAAFVGLPRLVRAAIVVFSGLGVMVLGAAVMSTGTAVVKAPATPSKAEQTEALAAAARKAFSEGQFSAAAGGWQSVLAVDSSNAEAKKGLALAKSADEGKGTLDQAQRAVDAKQYEDARVVLRAVPADSALAGAARALWAKADHEEAQGLFTSGEEQIHQKQFDAAKATVEKVKRLDDALYGKLSLDLDTAQDAAGGAKKK